MPGINQRVVRQRLAEETERAILRRVAAAEALVQRACEQHGHDSGKAHAARRILEVVKLDLARFHEERRVEADRARALSESTSEDPARQRRRV